jgi:hypothetical protein
MLSLFTLNTKNELQNILDFFKKTKMNYFENFEC